LGELAKIIGADNTQKDLLNVWWLYIDFEDEEVRTKAVESLYDIIAVVGNEVGRTLAQGLLARWSGGMFWGWRERETLLKKIVSWVNLTGLDLAPIAPDLLMKGLEDSVAAVREAAIVAVSVAFLFPVFLGTINVIQIPELWNLFSSQQEVIDGLGGTLRRLATSSNYRQRMAYVPLLMFINSDYDLSGQLCRISTCVGPCRRWKWATCDIVR
jgi:serine/threonine-protein phosphatase 4 regulatory subunit 1